MDLRHEIHSALISEKKGEKESIISIKSHILISNLKLGNLYKITHEIYEKSGLIAGPNRLLGFSHIGPYSKNIFIFFFKF